MCRNGSFRYLNADWVGVLTVLNVNNGLIFNNGHIPQPNSGILKRVGIDVSLLKSVSE